MMTFTTTRKRGFGSLMNELPEHRAWVQAKRAWMDAHIVYFAQFGGPGGLIKIGYTGDLAKRIHNLGKSAPLPVAALGWMEGGHGHEQRLHRMFQTSRFNGEWFNATADLIEYIEKNARIDTPPAKPSDAELAQAARERWAAVHQLRQAYDAHKSS
jgi:hypothetical protein